MKPKNVLSRNSLPAQLPIMATAVAYLLLDKFQPPEWVWGAVGLFFVLVWIAAIRAILQERQVDLLNEPPQEETK